MGGIWGRTSWGGPTGRTCSGMVCACLMGMVCACLMGMVCACLMGASHDQVWDVATKKQKLELPGHADEVRGLGLGHSGHVDEVQGLGLGLERSGHADEVYAC